MKNNKNNVIARRQSRRGNLGKLDCFVIAFLAMTMLPIAALAETVNVQVNGLVCSFCATAIEKTFAKEGVDMVSVNLDEKYVRFELPEGKVMSDEKITAAINDAGYEVKEIVRN